jgi:hypothetical protein
MKVSSFAGKPAEASMLVNAPGLITAYNAESFRGDHLSRILEEAQTIVNDAIAPPAPSATDIKEK